ncbi:hypothetical protein NUSPORA_00708 [Nucleospora cyclopteri]
MTIINYHKRYLKNLNIKPYIYSLILKKALESISFDRRHNLVENSEEEEELKDALERLEIDKALQKEASFNY